MALLLLANTVFFIAETLFCLLTPSCLIETDTKDHTGENCSPFFSYILPSYKYSWGFYKNIYFFK